MGKKTESEDWQRGRGRGEGGGEVSEQLRCGPADLCRLARLAWRPLCGHPSRSCGGPAQSCGMVMEPPVGRLSEQCGVSTGTSWDVLCARHSKFHGSHSLTTSHTGHRGEKGREVYGKLHKHKNPMTQCLYFALADDRSEAVLFSLLLLFPAQKFVLVCLPSTDPRPLGVWNVCGYVLLVLLWNEGLPETKGREKEILVIVHNLYYHWVIFWVL